MATLFIGIGSSGLRVLEEAQQFNYEFTGKNKPDDVHYLYLETNLSNKPRNTPLGTNDIVGEELSLKNMANSISQLRNNKNINSKWIPDPTTALSTSGAGGKSSYGRLSLWANFNNVKQKILGLNQIAGGFEAVYVTGSLTGGTGSGVLIDLAYLLRQLINPNYLFSILMIPKESDLDMNNSNFFINSYYAIKALEYYSQQGTSFKVMWPDNNPLPDSVGLKPPYDTNIIVSPDYFSQSEINNTFMCDYQDLSPLFKTIGLYVSLLGDKVLNIGLQDVASARWIDGAAGAGHISHFVTMGLALIQYPKALLEEYVALNYANKIVGDWIGDRYLEKKVQIKKRANKETEDAINYALSNELDDIGHESAKSITDYNIALSNNISRKKFEPYNSISELVFNTYRSDGDSNVYQQIKNNLFIARDSFIEQIAKKYSDIVKAVPNLQIAKHYLESIIEHLDALVLFWQEEYKLDDNVSNWNRLLSAKIKQIEKNRSNYELFGLNKEYVQEQLGNITMMMKLHLLVNEIGVLKKHLQFPDTTLSTKDNKHSLPSLKQVDKYMEALTDVIDNPGQNIAFSKRENLINTMSNSYGMLFNVYPKGSFKDEVNSLKSSIDLKKIIEPNVVLKKRSLWEFLIDSKNLYFNILTPMVKLINDNNDNNNIPLDNLILQSVDTNLQDLVGADKSDLKYSPPALVKLDQNIGSRSVFQDSNFLKTIYLYKDLPSMNIIRDSVRNAKNLKTDNLDGQTFCKNSNMVNSIAIFKSFSYYEGNQNDDVSEKSLIPTRDLTSLKNSREQFISESNLNNSTHIIERIPYFNVEQIKENLIKKSKK
jgi:hypothetical protein